MAGEEQIDVARLLAFDLDRLPHDLHVLPAVAELVLVRIARIQLVDVEVLLIDREDRQAEGDLAVVPDGDARQSRFARSDHRHPGRIQMHDVAQGRHAMGTVGIVRQDRPARCGPGA